MLPYTEPPRGSEVPRPVSNRQACSLLLLTTTLIGSCIALAVRTLLESGSGMLLMLLALGLLASSLSVTMSLTRRYIRHRRQQGHRFACFGCIELLPIEQTWAPATIQTDRPSAQRDGNARTRMHTHTHTHAPSARRVHTLSHTPAVPPRPPLARRCPGRLDDTAREHGAVYSFGADVAARGAV